jgi:hypothetical protein
VGCWNHKNFARVQYSDFALEDFAPRPHRPGQQKILWSRGASAGDAAKTQRRADSESMAKIALVAGGTENPFATTPIAH